MGSTIEEKKSELERLKKENEQAEEEERLDKEIAKEKRKKKDRSLIGRLLREIK
jgi:hypothetical protein